MYCLTYPRQPSHCRQRQRQCSAPLSLFSTLAAYERLHACYALVLWIPTLSPHTRHPHGLLLCCVWPGGTPLSVPTNLPTTRCRVLSQYGTHPHTVRLHTRHYTQDRLCSRLMLLAEHPQQTCLVTFKGQSCCAYVTLRVAVLLYIHLSLRPLCWARCVTCGQNPLIWPPTHLCCCNHQIV